MDFTQLSKKDIGSYGEKVAAEYLRRNGFAIEDVNVVRKTGEIDIIARKDTTLHFVEVKTIICREFPLPKDIKDSYQPSDNIHALKLRKIARTSEWYVADKGWEGDMQIDAVLVWLRGRDGVARVRYFPQIL